MKQFWISFLFGLALGTVLFFVLAAHALLKG